MSAGPATAPASSVWPMYRALVGVGLFCGLLIVTVYEVTRPIIARNRAEALQRAILDVLPRAHTSATFRLGAEGGFEELDEDPAGGRVAHAGYDEAGRLVGMALEADGMGYQDTIRILYGVSFEEQAVIGLQVLESRETPGLGDKIETDAEFRKNFERLDVSLAADGQRILNPIHAVKRGAKEHAWQVDGITGATISSVAIADMLRRSTSWWIPRIHSRQADFRSEQ